MKFDDFLRDQKTLLEKAIDTSDGTPHWYQTVRDWNAMAQMSPEKCEDVVQLNKKRDNPDQPIRATYELLPNPWRTQTRNVVTRKATKKTAKKTHQVSGNGQSSEATQAATETA